MLTHRRIKPLPLHLANQIAAGEVIERPASVVKELIENSLDAGATQIDVRIEGAGSQLIQVQDNGHGIHPDDLLLALRRHATSKLHSSVQLSKIESLGFRGEALPSIASVSLLTLSSRQQDSIHGWQITAGKTDISPVPHPVGTRVEVRDLFFNVPARRHFLRSNKTEQHHILTTLHRLALSQFETGFNCKISDKIQIKLPPAHDQKQRQQRLRKICGRDFIHNSLYIRQNYQNISLHGWIGNSTFHRPQTDIQYFFINGRVIRDRVINHAIRQAYGHHIPAGRQAAFVLYLNLPLENVDINVHPTKHEVRFRDARLIHGLITSAIQDALLQTKPQSTEQDLTALSPENRIEEQAQHYQTQQMLNHTLVTMPGKFGQILTLVDQRYALCQSSSELFLIDCQKIDFQLRSKQLEQAIEQKNLVSRPILVPVKVVLPPECKQRLQNKQSLLEQYAIKLKFNPDNVMVIAIPSLLTQADLTLLIEQIAQVPNCHDEQTQLKALLLHHLPVNPVQKKEQAKQLIVQTDFTLKENEHYIKLDQQRLDSLFSK